MMCIIKLGYTEMSLDSPFSIYLQNSHRGQKNTILVFFASQVHQICYVSLGLSATS
jgi:hypothetical protein